MFSFISMSVDMKIFARVCMSMTACASVSVCVCVCVHACVCVCCALVAHPQENRADPSGETITACEL